MLTIAAKEAIFEYNQAAGIYADVLDRAAREGKQPDRAAYDAMMIAKAARAQMERFAVAHDEIGFPEDLSCYCAIASYFLVQLAKKFGHELDVAEGIAFDPYVDKTKPIRSDDVNHCWTIATVQIGGKPARAIVDITATQFDHNLPKVYIVPARHPQYLLYAQGMDNVAPHWEKEWNYGQSPLLWVKQLRPYLNAAAKELRA